MEKFVSVVLPKQRRKVGFFSKANPKKFFGKGSSFRLLASRKKLFVHRIINWSSKSNKSDRWTLDSTLEIERRFLKVLPWGRWSQLPTETSEDLSLVSKILASIDLLSCSESFSQNILCTNCTVPKENNSTNKSPRSLPVSNLHLGTARLVQVRLCLSQTDVGLLMKYGELIG